jgi:hypothetical protein
MNGAIKVEIDGNVIGLKFAYPAIRMFLDEMAAKSKFYYSQSDGGDPMMTVEGIAKFIQCGYKNDCMIKEVDEVFNYEFFYNWVEQMNNDASIAEAVKKIFECYGNTEIKRVIDNAVKLQLFRKKTQVAHRSAGIVQTLNAEENILKRWFISYRKKE